MTNPNNSVGTNGAFGGRTSVNALNDVLAAFDGAGIVSGWKCVPSSGMTVAIGGQSSTVRDVAIAEDPYGNRTTINNILASPVSITISAASASSNRYTSIIAYVNSPTNADDTTLDNPSVVGIIAVNGTAKFSPSVPSESVIRTAITADGGTGSAAYYVKLADIYVRSGLTTITSSYITQEGMYANLSSTMQFRPYYYGNDQTYTTTATTSIVTLQSISVKETGAYMVFCDGWLNENGVTHGSNIYPAISVWNGSTSYGKSQVQLHSDSDNANKQIDLDTTTLVPASAGDTIYIKFQQNNASVAGMIYAYNYAVTKVSG